MNEEWRPVPSLSGVMASSLGRIVLPPKEARMPHGGMRKYTPKPTFGYVSRASKNAKHAYRAYRSKEHGNIKIHRAVCEAFHGPPPFDSAVVIHLDEDAMNNRPENLKWGTQRENLNMQKIKEYHRSRTGDASPYRKGLAKRAA